MNSADLSVSITDFFYNHDNQLPEFVHNLSPNIIEELIDAIPDSLDDLISSLRSILQIDGGK